MILHSINLNHQNVPSSSQSQAPKPKKTLGPKKYKPILNNQQNQQNNNTNGVNVNNNNLSQPSSQDLIPITSFFTQVSSSNSSVGPTNKSNQFTVFQDEISEIHPPKSMINNKKPFLAVEHQKNKFSWSLESQCNNEQNHYIAVDSPKDSMINYGNNIDKENSHPNVYNSFIQAPSPSNSKIQHKIINLTNSQLHDASSNKSNFTKTMPQAPSKPRKSLHNNNNNNNNNKAPSPHSMSISPAVTPTNSSNNIFNNDNINTNNAPSTQNKTSIDLDLTEEDSSTQLLPMLSPSFHALNTNNHNNLTVSSSNNGFYSNSSRNASISRSNSLTSCRPVFIQQRSISNGNNILFNSQSSSTNNTNPYSPENQYKHIANNNSNNFNNNTMSNSSNDSTEGSVVQQHVNPHPVITVNTNLDSLASSQFSDYCTPINQPVKERTDEILKDELFNNRIQRLNESHSNHVTNPNNNNNPVINNNNNNNNLCPANKKCRVEDPSSISNSFSMISLSQNLPNLDRTTDHAMMNNHNSMNNSPHYEIEEPMLNPFIPDELLNNYNLKSRKRISLENNSNNIHNHVNNSRFSTEFEYLCSIGSGSFGDVLLARHRLDGCDYAVKRIKKKLAVTANNRNSKQKQYLLHEIFGWSALQLLIHCPYIIRYHTCWLEDHQLYIQSEYCNGGSLGNQLKQGKTFDIENLFTIALHIGKALLHLHNLGFAHLDIKPDNILQSSENIYKLCDLGLITRLNAEKQDQKTQHIGIGDKRYLPAEALENEDNLNKIQLDKIDMYSLGVTLYELGTAIPLGSSEIELLKIRNGDLSTLHHTIKHEGFINLICNLLCYEPNQRMSSSQLVQLLDERENNVKNELIKMNNKQQELINKLQAELQAMKTNNTNTITTNTSTMTN